MCIALNVALGILCKVGVVYLVQHIAQHVHLGTPALNVMLDTI